MNQTAKTFLAIGLVLSLWAGAVGISQYVQNEPERKLVAEGKLPHDHSRGKLGDGEKPEAHQHSEKDVFSEFVGRLETAVEEEPENFDKKMELANAYFQAGVGMGDANYLKRAAGLYHEIVEKDDTKTDALLGLATLSLHVGVFEKAIEYYEKYIKLVPTDLGAKANLALAKGRGGDTPSGLKLVNEVLAKESKFVIGLVTKGILLKESGKLKQSKALFDQAMSLEENPALKDRIAQLSSTDEQKSLRSGTPTKSKVEAYFKNHEILKNKFKDLYEEGSTIIVNLENFPVEGMPPFARAKLEASLLKVIEDAGYKAIILKSAENGSELIKVEVK